MKLALVAAGLIVSLWANAPVAHATAHAPIAVPPLEAFAASVQNEQAGVLRGLYVAKRLAFRVEQQPYGNPNYISPVTNVATQYRLASYYGVTGLLAHNTASGRAFSRLAVGDKISLVYGDGRIKRYSVAAVYRYRVLNPARLKSDWVDLSTGEVLSPAEVFARVYIGEDQVTLQTCIQKGGNAAWGRLFVIATPLAPNERGHHPTQLMNRPESVKR